MRESEFYNQYKQASNTISAQKDKERAKLAEDIAIFIANGGKIKKVGFGERSFTESPKLRGAAKKEQLSASSTNTHLFLGDEKNGK